MNRLSLAALAAAGSLFLTACDNQAPVPAVPPTVPAEAAEDDLTVAPEAAPMEETCDILDSRDWEAWLDVMPGIDPTPTIHVVGKVDVRTGGYTFEWQEGPLDRSAMPALRLNLIPVKPDDMALQAIMTEEVHYSAPATVSYSRVLVACGGETIAEIDEITEAH